MRRSGEVEPTWVDAGRAFGVVFVGPLLLSLGVGWSLVSAMRSLLKGGAPSRRTAIGLLGLLAYLTWAVPRLRRWGTSPTERSAPLPGDEFVPDPAFTATRAVWVEAPIDEVWPWLAQIGQDRAGFYSHEWLENLAGCRMRNADRIHPEWQERSVGETVMLHPGNGLPVSLFARCSTRRWSRSPIS